MQECVKTYNSGSFAVDISNNCIPSMVALNRNVENHLGYKDLCHSLRREELIAVGWGVGVGGWGRIT